MTTSIKSLIIGIVIFGIFMGATVGILSSISDNLLNNQTSDFNDSFNIIDDTTSEIDSLEEDTKADIAESRGEAGFFDVVFKGTWTGLKQIFTSFAFFKTAIGDLADWLDIPGYILAGISAIITIIIIFGVIKAVTKTDI